MTNEIELIIDKVKSGMIMAYNDTLNFTGNPAQNFGAEYLFTVNVAKAIGELNCPNGDPYKIFIEARVNDIKKDCLPIYKKNNVGGFLKKTNTIFRCHHPLPAIGRNGRVDIAVYKEGISQNFFGNVPFCVIELKSFDPTRSLVVKDLKRNTELLRASGATGNSSLQVGVFSAVHQVKEFDTQEKINIRIKEIISDYKKWCSEIGDTNDLIIVIDHFILSSDLEGEVTHDIDESVIDRSTRHYFIGIIIKITLKSK